MTNQKMKTYFVNFFFIQNPLSFAISVVYDLTFVTMDNLVVDFTYEWKPITKTSHKFQKNS